MKRTLFLLVLLVVLSLSTMAVQAESGRGGVLTVGTGMDIKQLDPAFVSDLPSQRVAEQIFDYLVRRDAEGNIKPALASEWEVSADGLVWTFSLTRGVKFSDGSDFNAEVVKWHFDRLRDPEVASNYVEQFGIIEEVKVVDDYTVQFTLERPYGPLIDTVLMAPGGMIPSKEHFEKVGADLMASDPVGTGPFVFTEWQPGNYVLLSRNENYFRTDVKLDGLKFKPIAEAMTRIIELQTGGIDYLDTVPYTDMEQLKADENVTVFSGKSVFSLLYIWYNVTDASPFKDNPELREAVSYAIDRNRISQLLYGDYGIPCESYVPVASWAYPDDPDGLGYSVEKAREILTGAGYEYRGNELYKDGERVEIEYLSTSSESMWTIIAQYVQEALRDIGIKVTINQLEWGSYLDIFTGTKNYQMSSMSWVQNTGEPTLFMDTLVKTNERGNFTGYSNPELDEILTEASETADRSRRQELYNQAYEILGRELPLYPIVSKPLLRAIRSRVKGYVYTPYVADFTQGWIEK